MRLEFGLPEFDFLRTLWLESALPFGIVPSIEQLREQLLLLLDLIVQVLLTENRQIFEDLLQLRNVIVRQRIIELASDEK